MNLVLVTCAMAALLLSSVPAADASLCDLEVVKQSAGKHLLGGWQTADGGSVDIVKLVQNALSQAKMESSGSLQLTEYRDIIEAYSQVVQGMNFCIRFSASGSCSNYHCKSYECTASGHRPLSSNDITDVEVMCKEFSECDINNIREYSKTPMPGGWFNASLDDDRVRKLHEASSRLATVEHGPVVEAYYQVVAGHNYCIRFDSRSSGNCGNNCQPLTCVAGGFYPLRSGNLSSEVSTKVGVSCHRRAGAKLGSAGSIGGHVSATILTTVITVLISIIFV